MAAAAQLSALLPAVSLLEGRPPNGSHALEAHIEAAQLDAALSGQQLDYLRTFAVSLAATFAAQPEGSPTSTQTANIQCHRLHNSGASYSKRSELGSHVAATIPAGLTGATGAAEGESNPASTSVEAGKEHLDLPNVYPIHAAEDLVLA